MESSSDGFDDIQLEEAPTTVEGDSHEMRQMTRTDYLYLGDLQETNIDWPNFRTRALPWHSSTFREPSGHVAELPSGTGHSYSWHINNNAVDRTTSYRQPVASSASERIARRCRERERRLKRRRKFKIIRIISVIAILLLLLFMALFTPSVVFVNYYELAFLRSRITQSMDKTTVWQPGCYVLNPDAEFLKFKMSAHHIFADIAVFTRDGLEIVMQYKTQYFLNPEDLGSMYEKYGSGYESIFKLVISSTVKNHAITLAVDEFRLNRSRVEKHFHEALKQNLHGNCCSSCCPLNCSNNSTCLACQPRGSCDQGYFIQVRYFELGAVKIPDEVYERYLAQLLLQVDAEKENFFLEKAVIVKETEQKVKVISNEAAEIVSDATISAGLLTAQTVVDAAVVRERAHYAGIKDMCLSLNISQQDHKLSMFYINTLNKRLENKSLLCGYKTLWTSK